MKKIILIILFVLVFIVPALAKTKTEKYAYDFCFDNSETDGHGSYCSCLKYSTKPNNKDVEADMAAAKDAWIYFVDHQPAPEEPSISQLKAKREALISDVFEVTNQIYLKGGTVNDLQEIKQDYVDRIIDIDAMIATK